MTSRTHNVPLKAFGIRAIAVVLVPDELETNLAAAYDEGLTAGQSGEGMEACPYLTNAPECGEWLRGWDVGRARPKRPRHWRDL